MVPDNPEAIVVDAVMLELDVGVSPNEGAAAYITTMPTSMPTIRVAIAIFEDDFLPSDIEIP